MPNATAMSANTHENQATPRIFSRGAAEASAPAGPRTSEPQLRCPFCCACGHALSQCAKIPPNSILVFASTMAQFLTIDASLVKGFPDLRKRLADLVMMRHGDISLQVGDRIVSDGEIKETPLEPNTLVIMRIGASAFTDIECHSCTTVMARIAEQCDVLSTLDSWYAYLAAVGTMTVTEDVDSDLTEAIVIAEELLTTRIELPSAARVVQVQGQARADPRPESEASESETVARVGRIAALKHRFSFFANQIDRNIPAADEPVVLDAAIETAIAAQAEGDATMCEQGIEMCKRLFQCPQVTNYLRIRALRHFCLLAAEPCGIALSQSVLLFQALTASELSSSVDQWAVLSFEMCLLSAFHEAPFRFFKQFTKDIYQRLGFFPEPLSYISGERLPPAVPSSDAEQQALRRGHHAALSAAFTAISRKFDGIKSQ